MTTDITYSYEIIHVDEAAKAMEVVYSSPDFGKLHVGARLPFEGEALEDVIRMFAPVAFWREESRPAVAVPLGASGTLVDAVAPPPEPVLSAPKADLVRAMRNTVHGETTIWEAVRAQLALADEATQEDWLFDVTIPRDYAVLNAVFTTLFGEGADAALDAVFADAVPPS